MSAPDAESIGVTLRSPEEVGAADLVLLQTNHPSFASQEFLRKLADALPTDGVVVDMWNQLPSSLPGRDDVQILTLGRMSVEVPR